jgi:hypothetical protein
MNAVLSAVAPLADDVNNFGDTRGGALAGPLGLFFVVMLAIATVLLIRNMNKRLRRLPASFPDQRPGHQPENAGGAEKVDRADSAEPEIDPR